NYGALTAEERFRLIFAASARGDSAEQERLNRASGRLHLSTQDHAPFANAFDDLNLIVFLDLLELAREYEDALERAFDCTDLNEPADNSTDPMESDTAGDSLNEQCWQLALYAGFRLKVQADGWVHWCESKGIPPFADWEYLPGFRRLKRKLQYVAGTEEL